MSFYCYTTSLNVYASSSSTALTRSLEVSLQHGSHEIYDLNLCVHSGCSCAQESAATASCMARGAPPPKWGLSSRHFVLYRAYYAVFVLMYPV